jgi:hypothetical protein
MSFFHSAIGVLQTLVIALGAGLAGSSAACHTEAEGARKNSGHATAWNLPCMTPPCGVWTN